MKQLILMILAGLSCGRAVAADPAHTGGVLFSCAPDEVPYIAHDMDAYLRALDIDERLVVKTIPGAGELLYTLATPEADVDTLGLKDRPEYGIRDERVNLPAEGGKTRSVMTVSRKEIVLALLQHGRLTQLSGVTCTVDALRDMVGVRQNVVSWTRELSWDWPDGEAAHWNPKNWRRGTPVAGVKLDTALLDPFIHQAQYGFGCYTASKLSYAHAVLDYYARIKHDTITAAIVRSRLMADKDPLVGVEPAGMWYFEDDFDPSQRDVPGKLLGMTRNVAPGNFVPGDWTYMRNTDPKSSKKTGYEGSNAVYLGGGRFDDYYDDNHHSYTYREKMNEVYQWRNGVFSRSRDAAKIQPLTNADYARLGLSPEQGGLVLDYRVAPYFFGYQALPPLPGARS